jgi:hypothetical protein
MDIRKNLQDLQPQPRGLRGGLAGARSLAFHTLVQLPALYSPWGSHPDLVTSLTRALRRHQP